MRKGELKELRDIIDVQQSQIEAWRTTCGTMIKMYEDERGENERLMEWVRSQNAKLDELRLEVKRLLSVSPSRT